MAGADPHIGIGPLLQEGIDRIVRRHAGPWSLDDQADLARWRAASPDHDAAYREAAVLGQAMRDVGRDLLDERARAAVVVPLKRPALSRRMVLTGAIAASVAGILTVGRSLDLVPALGGRTPDFATATGERRTVALAEGLKLELDAETSIAVDRAQGNRIELIAGRAEIQAHLAPARQVMLIAGNGTVTAQDARFDIRLDDGEACVTCLDGQVTIAHGDTRRPLGARQQIRYTDASIGQPVLIDPAEVAAWKTGQLVFHQTPLSEVVREVNRYRAGKVMIANGAVGRRPVNGVFHTAQINDAVVQIQQITGARAVHLPGNIVVLS